MMKSKICKISSSINQFNKCYFFFYLLNFFFKKKNYFKLEEYSKECKDSNYLKKYDFFKNNKYIYTL